MAREHPYKHEETRSLSRLATVAAVAVAVPLIVAGCSGGSGPQIDQRSYDAGYHSAGPGLVS